jgi:Nucleotide-diphospho-sugar transferase
MRRETTLHSAIAILYVNSGNVSTEDLNRICFLSMVRESNGTPIFVGTTDITNIPSYMTSYNNINILNLSTLATEWQISAPSRVASVWGDLNFNKLMLLKFQLLKQIPKKFNFVIYSDLDVYWRANVKSSLEILSKERPNVTFFFQDQTFVLDIPRICAGFFAFQNTEAAINFFTRALDRQLKMLQALGNYDDQEAIIDIINEDRSSDEYFFLPQTLFPTGYLLPLFRSTSAFPRLKRAAPLVMHLNFVVGGKSKLAMLYKSRLSHEDFTFALKFYANLILPTLEILRNLKTRLLRKN